MEKRSTVWYVSRRAELLTEQFLLDLRPDSIVASPPDGSPFDFVAFFTKPDGTPVTIGVVVKATQQEVAGHYSFPADIAARLLGSNVPVLVVVVDVKASEVDYNWIWEAVPPKKQATLGELRTCSLRLRKGTPEEGQQLRSDIASRVQLAS